MVKAICIKKPGLLTNVSLVRFIYVEKEKVEVFFLALSHGRARCYKYGTSIQRI